MGRYFEPNMRDLRSSGPHWLIGRLPYFINFARTERKKAQDEARRSIWVAFKAFGYFPQPSSVSIGSTRGDLPTKR